MIQLICADSMRLLPALCEKLSPSFDMAFIDPPFTEWLASETGEYNVNWLSVYVSRLLKSNGVVWLWGYIPQLVNDWHYWERWFQLLFEVVRVKPRSYPPPTNVQYPVRAHENCWCLIRKDAQPTNTKLNMKTGERVAKVRVEVGTHVMRDDGRTKVYKEYKQPVYVTSYQMYDSIGKGSKEYYGHPTQKPLQLVKLLIETSTEKGGWILDPFAGSGVTLAACDLTDRNCLAVEIDRQYCQIAWGRYKRIKEIAKIDRFIH